MTKFVHLTGERIVSGGLTPAGQRPGGDSGDPQLRVQQIGMEMGGKIGLWECRPGGWPVLNRPDTEFAYILEGMLLLTDSGSGETVELRPGDAIILPPDWTSRWDVKQTVRKLYVIH